MDEHQILTSLRQFVRDNFLYMRPDFQFADADSLLLKGVIDSLGVMEVVGFVEETWQITVLPADVTEQNFGSLAAIARYVATRPAAGAAS